MKRDAEHTTEISRRKFIQLCGTLIAGGSIVGISCILLSRTGFTLPCSDCQKKCPLRKGVNNLTGHGKEQK